MLPQARTVQLTVEELAEETLLFDHQRGKAHCLNGTARFIWSHCDGRTSLPQLARLVEQHLGIDEPKPWSNWPWNNWPSAICCKVRWNGPRRNDAAPAAIFSRKWRRRPWRCRSF